MSDLDRDPFPLFAGWFAASFAIGLVMIYVPADPLVYALTRHLGWFGLVVFLALELLGGTLLLGLLLYVPRRVAARRAKAAAETAANAEAARRIATEERHRVFELERAAREVAVRAAQTAAVAAHDAALAAEAEAASAAAAERKIAVATAVAAEAERLEL